MHDDDTVVIVPDPSGDGWSFETPDGDGYGGHSLDEAIDMARSLGYDYEVER